MASKAPTYTLDAIEKEIARPTSAVISVQDLVHRYEDRVALNGVSFDVCPAELFGLLGPNGSGKTTLFRILSTLMIPSGGRALIMGHDAARDPNGLRRRIGVVFQAQSIDLKLTAAENLRHQGHLYGLRGAALKSRIAEMLARVGLADRAPEKAETFSGGMQPSIELLFLSKGGLSLNGCEYGPNSAFEFRANEGPIPLKAVATAELLRIVLPKF